MRRRNFTVGEANALLPHLREILAGIQELRGEVGDRTDQIKILDVIWGRGVQDPENPDHSDFEGHRQAIGGAVREIERLIREEILGLGVRFPPGGLEYGLLDFPTRLDGRWVYLCWRLGEEELCAWHEVADGFDGRKPLTPQVADRMGKTEPEDAPDESDQPH
ncbi:MAG: DUF2203 domain-containing protein [Gemmatimonadetes bacterium]|nr:DUF2203 domain-containing protein [Gemmatimonadota bacterium]